MDKPDVFMPLYIGDYLAGTSRLTTELHGAYLLLIMDYWMNGPLPDDDALLASITKMTPDAWSNARAKLKHYFSIESGCWKQKRIEEELAAATEKKRKSRDKAKKAAAARWNDAPSNAPSNASAQLEECPSPSPSPSESIKDKTHVPPEGGTDDYPPEFERAWKDKPRREGGNSKKAAYKQWKARLRAGATVEDLTDGMERYRKFCEAKKIIGTDKVKMMATFWGPDEHYLEDYATSQSNGYDPTARDKSNDDEQLAFQRELIRMTRQ